MATIDTLAPVERRKVSRFRSTLQKCFSFPVLLGTLLVAINFAIEHSFRIEGDTWWHTKQGLGILATGHWPTVDNWSFTAHGMPAIATEWGGEVVMALAYRLAGLQGLEALLIVLTSAILLLLYYYAYLRCGTSKAAFVAALLVTPIAALSFTLRPQLIGYAFLLVTMIWLERYRLGMQKSLWLLIPLFLIWVNTHGTFAFGFFFLAIYWLSGLRGFSWGGLQAERWRPDQRLHLELVCLLSLAVMPLTPYGTRLASYPLRFALFLPLNLTNIIEWRPLDVSLGQGKLLFILLLAFILAQVALRLRYRLEELALFFVVAYLAFMHIRFAILFTLVFAPLLAVIMARWIPPYNPKIDKYALNAVLIAVVVLCFVTYFPSQGGLNRDVVKKFPVHAVEYLQRHPAPDPMFNNYGFGSYLDWAMGPEHKVFIDGRGDVFEPPGVLSDYMRVVDVKPEALAILKSYRIQSCLIQRDAPLATLLAAAPGWKLVYKDKLSALFVRQPQSPAPPTVAPGKHHPLRGSSS